MKFGPLSLRTCALQFTAPSLFSAPKISLGNGTTTSSTVVDSCLMLICCGAWAAFAHKARPQRRPIVLKISYKRHHWHFRLLISDSVFRI